LKVDDPIVQAWRETVRKLQEKPNSDKLNWVNLSAIHGTQAGFNKCPHRNWYFLPWHRGYLLMYERLARELTGMKDFALPYWDWTTNQQLPSAFVDPPDGSKNPLFVQRAMGPNDSLPDEDVGTNVIRTIMRESEFEVFGTSRPIGQNSLDQSWISNKSGKQGTLEFNPHNNVHGIVGGVMASSRSSLDPIFMMHHCNIDRIWAVWRAAGNLNTTDALWVNMPFQDHFLNLDGSPYSPKVSDLLETEPLGYTYGLAGVPASLPQNQVVLDSKLRTLFSTPAVSSAVGVRNFQADNAQEARANQPLDIAVKIDPGLVANVVRRPSLSSGTELVDFKRVREVAASRPRILAFIRDITVANDQTTQFRVFVNCDYLSQDTPISDSHYAATFGFFGTSTEHADHAASSITVDLTPTLERVFGSVPNDVDLIRVQILPVPRGRATISEIGSAKPSRVEIAYIPA
jgi:tyrosinase